ncbi:periplasmic thioredoxin of cytochrome c-type biogenesis [Umboniibacter marinipuniceus]|uniref:Thioredoxin n=1 Tax=Umboniibacter marinipuniceus TaxID=569599 RepID=A0A3M0A6G8_9GAMM|nr:periplasmic thioredoxin of cytochrome c-type biogenesis [Umboniibacter marinipuniceus]RMA79994.1 hypothetical protein DFR27_1350 [Umboniibacter marinipuniceus]
MTKFPYLIEADAVQDLLANNGTAVINLVAAWCPDCYEAQAANIDALRSPLVEDGVLFANLLVQEHKHEYLSPLHQALTLGFGGHGFPRTVLILNGEPVSSDNVEITDETALNQLASSFLQLIK